MVSIFGKCWDLHVRDILMTTEEENFAMIGDTVAFLREHGRRVIFDAEHFFDGYQANPAFAWEALASAVKAGGGGAGPVRYQRRHVPREVARITREVAERFPSGFGGHPHPQRQRVGGGQFPDGGGGHATHIQGTFLGFGERSGNANLSTIIPNLQLKRGYVCIPTAIFPAHRHRPCHG